MNYTGCQEHLMGHMKYYKKSCRDDLSQKITFLGFGFGGGYSGISSNFSCHQGLKEPESIVSLSGGGDIQYFFGQMLYNRVDTVASGIVRLQVNKGKALHYYDWLLNRSPYQEAFLSDSAEQVLKDKIIFADVNCPSTLMAAGLIASRATWEWGGIVECFYDLCRAGVKEDLAHYFAQSISPKNEEGNVYLGHREMTHTVLDSGIVVKSALLNYLNHDYQGNVGTYLTNKNYSGIDEMYNNCGGPNPYVNPPFTERLKRLGMLAQVANNKALNPFRKAIKIERHTYHKYDDVIKALAESQDELLKEIGYA